MMMWNNVVCRFVALVAAYLFVVPCPLGARTSSEPLLLGDERSNLYLPLLEGQRVAIFSNQTGCNSAGQHVLDLLLAQGVEVTTLFSPEHGFRGTSGSPTRDVWPRGGSPA